MSERELSGNSGRLRIIEVMADAIRREQQRPAIRSVEWSRKAPERMATAALDAALPMIRTQLAGRIREREVQVGLGDVPLPADWWEIYRDAAKVIKEAE